MALKTPMVYSEGQREFAKMFSALCNRHSAWQVWADFVEMTATSISNAVDRSEIREKREKRYTEIIKRYTPDEQGVFPKLIGIMVEAMEEDQDQDFLGTLFMTLELGSHWKGQFFTPYSICRMMAEMECKNAKMRSSGRDWIAVNDPACGAGALLIAARNMFEKSGVGPDNVLFVAQDIDRVAGLMCYIQLSLLGCAGYVVIADTLYYPITGSNPLFPAFNENHEVWYMPMWYAGIWNVRRMRRSRSSWRMTDGRTQTMDA